VYHHQAPQESADGDPEYADLEKEVLTHKAIGVRNFLFMLVASL
jgi:hypothetical protein